MSDPALPITRQHFPAFLMSVPLSLSTDEANNVWMRELSAESRRIDLGKAVEQFHALYSFLTAQAMVYLLPSRPGLQDQTYVANLGVVLPHLPDPVVVISNFRSPPRRAEQEPGLEFFRQLSLKVEVAPAYFEGEADLKWIGDNVYVGAHGMRTCREALDWFAEHFDMEVIPFEIDNEYLYHLDCSIFPITREDLVVCTEVAEPDTLRAIERHASIIDVSVDNADSGITNCVRIGDHVVCASHLEELSSTHKDYAYEKQKVKTLEEICEKLRLNAVFFNLSEFLKSGAMLSCMIMHLNYKNF